MIPAEFLADTGADRTVFSAAILHNLALQTLPADNQLGGVGGTAATVIVETVIHLQRDDGGVAVFHGQFAAFTEPEALDMSVLGRDISNLFAVVVDRQRDLVCLLGTGHQYSITSSP
jgi:hypothetical protein